MTDALSAQMQTLAAEALNDCDREPIHIPGSIQPHGMLIVIEDGRVAMGAGDIEDITGRADWLGASLEDVFGAPIRDALDAVEKTSGVSYLGRWAAADGRWFDVTTHLSQGRRIVEAEPGEQAETSAVALLGRLDEVSAAFERAPGMRQLCARAAEEFRDLTGFDRVMIYRFLDDGAGSVVGEARAEGMSPFMNHHFPATDIPVQARALYVRNPVRVIPDVAYAPRPLRPAETADAPLDMSDCSLRSVSPIHVQYLRNMGVGASASVSIVVEGTLWGLVACHHGAPRLMTHETRVAATALARGLARQLKAKDEAELYRERVRLRGLEDELLARIPLEQPLEQALASNLDALKNLTAATGAAVVKGSWVTTAGVCPPANAVMALAQWVARTTTGRVRQTTELAAVYPPARDWQAVASGMMAVTVATEDPFVVLWFRAEKVEVVRWAGDPHAGVKRGPLETLTPRASFEDWSETVRGRSERWTTPEIETAARLREALFDLRAQRQMQAVNETLRESVADRDLRIEHQDYLLREVNHRVQNSLSLVSSFLALQARGQAESPAIAEALGEARRRVSAVSLVHRRLYRADQVETVDLGRYFSELLDEMGASSGSEWAEQTHVELAPVSVASDRAVTFGLILTELVINAQKYAYGGRPGPIAVALEQDRGSIRLIVSDEGVGGHQLGKGFGSRMIDSLIGQLKAVIQYQSAKPGLRVVVTAPID